MVSAGYLAGWCKVRDAFRNRRAPLACPPPTCRSCLVSISCPASLL